MGNGNQFNFEHTNNADLVDDLRLLIGVVRANFNTYKTSCIAYLDYLVYLGSIDCKGEREKYENIMGSNERFVVGAINEANEHKKELMSEQILCSLAPEFLPPHLPLQLQQQKNLRCRKSAQYLWHIQLY